MVWLIQCLLMPLKHWVGHNFGTMCQCYVKPVHVHNQPAQLQNHDNWFVQESIKFYTLSLTCELGPCFQKQGQTIEFEDFRKEPKTLVCLCTYFEIYKQNTENPVLGNHKINIFHFFLTIAIPEMMFTHHPPMQKIDSDENLGKHLIRYKVYNSLPAYHDINHSV